MSEDRAQEATEERPRSAFGVRRAPALDKNGAPLRGFTTPEHHSEYWTPERRAEQSQRAKDLIAQGRLGGAAGFHRRRVKRFQEIAAEHAQEKADTIIQKLDAMIDQPKDKRLQLEAIREYMKMEAWAVQNTRDDEKEMRKLSGAQLDARLLETMGDALGLDLSGLVNQAKQTAGADVIQGFESPECEACQAERDRTVELLHDSGVDDDELIAATASRARCQEHRS